MISSPPQSSRSGSLSRISCWIAAAIIVVGFALRVWNPGQIYFNIHAERDFWRTLQLIQGDDFPYTGSELTQGGRTMGPALYWLQAPALVFSLDPRAMLVWLALLHAGALWLTYRMGAENFSRATGIAASALFATFPLAVLALRYVWNPSFIFPLSTLFYWAIFGFFFRAQWHRLPLAAGAWCLLFQVHLSALVMLFAFVVGLFIFRPGLPRRFAIITAGTVLFLFAPYIMGDAMHGFSNTKAIFIPPARLETANDANIPIQGEGRRRLHYNVGAMKALQVALSPVFYDRRYETGSFSYLNLLAEFGPYQLKPPVWRLVYTAHQIRWLYVAAFLGSLALCLWYATVGKRHASRVFGNEDGSTGDAHRRALFLLVSVLLATAPMLVTTTMAAPKDGKSIGVGAIRYFFVMFPLPFLLWALCARWVAVVIGAKLKFRRVLVAVPIVAICFLQAAVVAAHLTVAKSKGRSLKYSLYESYDWTTISEAASFLIREWGVSEEQFRTRTFTLRSGPGGNYYLFNSQHHDVASLEQGLDWAFHMNKDRVPGAPAKHPDSYILLYDASRPPADLSKYKIEAEHRVKELVLLRVSNGEQNSISPIQNTWVRIERARRLK
ncbi:hypothetical protein IT570_08055 [Candidatus Sumerlaeota bacterium]|nr:hypothetical protein [Candidatus Sumerlaeota bacterium]